MKIRELTDQDQDIWDNFVASNPAATCFHWYGWRRPLSDILGYQSHYIAAFEGETIVGILPLFFVSSRLFGKSMVSLPFCSYGGVVAASSEACNELLAHGISLAKANRAAYLEVRNLNVQAAEIPLQDLYVTFRKSLPTTIDDKMLCIPSKRRNMVRRALKQGLTTEVAPNLDAFFDLYLQNARAHGTPALPKAFFAELIASLGDKLDILFVKDVSGRAVSCIMNFYAHGDIHAGFAGEAADARFSSANDLKYWALMVHAVQRGCTVFDFGRSKVGTGSYSFKKLWGFEAQSLAYSYPYLPGGNVPQNNPTNAKYAIAINVWKRLPLWLVNFIGPRIIHGLG
jgi:FemAB-related protein (PEP-CTERM system-associated)